MFGGRGGHAPGHRRRHRRRRAVMMTHRGVSSGSRRPWRGCRPTIYRPRTRTRFWRGLRPGGSRRTAVDSSLRRDETPAASMRIRFGAPLGSPGRLGRGLLVPEGISLRHVFRVRPRSLGYRRRGRLVVAAKGATGRAAKGGRRLNRPAALYVAILASTGGGRLRWDDGLLGAVDGGRHGFGRLPFVFAGSARRGRRRWVGASRPRCQLRVRRGRVRPARDLEGPR